MLCGNAVTQGGAVQFTQLDMEMSFMDADAIMSLAEQLVASVMQQVGPAVWCFTV